MDSLIVAQSNNGYIGKDGSLPWKSKAEMSFFKQMTLNSNVIMGRVTFESLKKPLVDRLNIVVTSRDMVSDGTVIYINSVEEALVVSKLQSRYDKTFVIGGASIYDYVLKYNLVDTVYVSKFPFDVDGDTKMPDIPSNYILSETIDKEEFLVLKYVRT